MQRVVNEQHGNVGCARSICVSVKGGGGCQIALHNDSMFGLTKLDYDDLLERKEKPGRLHLQLRRGLIESGRAMMMREDQGE